MGGGSSDTGGAHGWARWNGDSQEGLGVRGPGDTGLGRAVVQEGHPAVVVGHGGREVLQCVLRGEPRDGDHQGHHLENLEPAPLPTWSRSSGKAMEPAWRRQWRCPLHRGWPRAERLTRGARPPPRSISCYSGRAAQGMAAVPDMQIQPGVLWAPSLRVAPAGTRVYEV